MNREFPKKIGGVGVSSPIWLAPLAGVTTLSFRRFHERMGAALVHTEMVSALGLKYGGAKTKMLLGPEREAGEAPIALQLFGSDAEHMKIGAEIALAIKKFDALEINMACPMPKVTKKDSGSKLLDFPDIAAEMTSALTGFGVPVWVKLRIVPHGERRPMNTDDFCRMLFDVGASLLMIHGRTPAQRYEGTADKDEICRIARLFPERIVGSGDYYAPADAKFYLDNGCAAVLAARGAIRDAFLIPRTHALLGFDVAPELVDPPFANRLAAIKRLGEESRVFEGESFALISMRRMLGGVFKNFSGVAALRQKISAVRSWDEMSQTLDSLI